MSGEIVFDLDETKAQAALAQINRVMASVFGKEPIAIRFVFLSFIHGSRSDLEVLGLCVRAGARVEIQLKGRPGWQRTAVHELVHAYAPEYSEARVKQATDDAVKLLKLSYGGK